MYDIVCLKSQEPPLNIPKTIYSSILLPSLDFRTPPPLHTHPIPWASLRLKKGKISIVFDDLSIHSVVFQTEVKPEQYYSPNKIIPTQEKGS